MIPPTRPLICDSAGNAAQHFQPFLLLQFCVLAVGPHCQHNVGYLGTFRIALLTIDRYGFKCKVIFSLCATDKYLLSSYHTIHPLKRRGKQRLRFSG
jgi:hypothetical protein